ncbi:MAG: single-stranded DNA-binding protein [Patescibacteria group bacterium]
MSRSVNKVILVGNLTRDPEMRYTPQGHAVTTFGLATNRAWKVEGDRKEETEFHNIVAWNKLAELCTQLLKKGTKVFIEGRLQTRDWVDDKGVKHYKTEIVAEDMVVLGGRRENEQDFEYAADTKTEFEEVKAEKPEKKTKSKKDSAVDEDISSDEIPF